MGHIGDTFKTPGDLATFLVAAKDVMGKAQG